MYEKKNNKKNSQISFITNSFFVWLKKKQNHKETRKFPNSTIDHSHTSMLIKTKQILLSSSTSFHFLIE